MKSYKILILFLVVYCACKQEKTGFVPQAIPKPLDIFLLLDQSGSMKQTDPQNNRIEAARFLVDYLASYWAKVQDHRVGLINFGDSIPPNPEDEMVGLTSLDTAKRTKIDTLKQKIISLDLRDTKFIEAFRKAKKGFLIAQDTIPRQKVIILLTDGEPDDQRRLTRDAYFREITTYFNDSLSDCHLYVLAIDINNRYWSSNEPYWRRIARYTERLVSVEEERLKEAFWRVTSMEMEVVAERWYRIPPEGLKVTLDPYLEGVTFTLHRELPQAEITILDPNG
ncbi:MAG: vWA domain-containing protein, partial [candidate division WOR-3 bacterium]